MSLNLFSSEPFSDKKISNSYEISNPVAFCGKIMNLPDFKCLDSTVIVYDKSECGDDLEISSFSELVLFSQTTEICMCQFHGDYLGNSVDITVDFETDLLYIVSGSLEMIEFVKKALEALL